MINRCLAILCLVSAPLYADLVQEYFPNGQVQYETNLVGDLNHGLSRAYNQKGIVVQEIMFEHGEKHGPAKEYYDNGVLKYSYNYVHDKLEGEVLQYYPDGKIMVQANYHNDLKQGPYKEYYEGGLIKSEYNFNQGRWEGEAKEYYPNGGVRLVLTLKNGLLHGASQEYYETGELWKEANYLNDMRHGRYLEYDKKGRKRLQGYLVQNKEVGTFIELYENGAVALEVNFEDGKRNGLGRVFNRVGEVIEYRFFLNDELVFKEKLDQGKSAGYTKEIDEPWVDVTMEQVKNTQAVIQEWWDILKTNPKREDAWLQMAIEKVKIGRLRAAWEDLGKAIKLDVSFAVAYAYRAQLSEMLGEPALAQKDYERMLKLGVHGDQVESLKELLPRKEKYLS